MSVQRAAAGAGLAAAITVAGTAMAAPAAQAAAAKPTYLALSVRVEGARPLLATLRCQPPRGSHTHAAEACAAVDAVKGKLANLKPQDGVMCTMEYRPATAVAKGTWRGRAVQYKKTFSNSCALGAGTGPVFRF
jgi:hypothetical protein